MGCNLRCFFPVSNSGHQEAYIFLGSDPFKESFLIMYTLKILIFTYLICTQPQLRPSKIRLNGNQKKKTELGNPSLFKGPVVGFFGGFSGPITQHTFNP